MDFWKEGKYIDFWNIIHLLSGFMLASLLFFILKINFSLSLVIAIILFIIAEIVEPAKETIQNKFLDIISDIIGFFIGCKILSISGPKTSTLIITILLAIWIFLNIIAWKNRR